MCSRLPSKYKEYVEIQKSKMLPTKKLWLSTYWLYSDESGVPLFWKIRVVRTYTILFKLFILLQGYWHPNWSFCTRPSVKQLTSSTLTHSVHGHKKKGWQQALLKLGPVRTDTTTNLLCPSKPAGPSEPKSSKLESLFMIGTIITSIPTGVIESNQITTQALI